MRNQARLLTQQRDNVNDSNSHSLDSSQARGWSHQTDDAEPGMLTISTISEAIGVTAKKYPIPTIVGIVSAAVAIISTIVGAVVFVAVGAFTMYGTQRETLSELKALRADYAEVRAENAAIRKQQSDDMNSIRAYASNNARRTEFIVGLMTSTQQKSVSQFDRSNPRLELPGAPGKREQ